MIFGGAKKERIQLNEDTVWSGAPGYSRAPDSLEHLPRVRKLLDAGRYDEADQLCSETFMASPPGQATYLPLGDLLIEMSDMNPQAHPFSDYERSLNLDSSLVTTGFRYRGTLFTRRYIASAERNVMAIEYTAGKPGLISCHITANSPHAHTSVEVQGERDVVLNGRTGLDLGVSGAIKFQGRFRVTTSGGQIQSRGDFVEVTGADTMTVYIGLATNYKRFNDVSGVPEDITRGYLDGVTHLDFAHFAQEAMNNHRAIFRRVELDLGESSQSSKSTDDRISDFRAGKDDPALFKLYFDYGRYLLIASSRPGSQPPSLQGIWNNDLEPNWQSKYTVNINLEMNYWHAETTALSEMVEPLVSLLEDLVVTGSETAQKMYGARGWVCHHNTDLWRATAPIDAPSFGLWPMGGAWLSRTLWDRYDYGRDEAFLKRIHPIFKGACLFYLDAALERNGEMVMSPSMSPENPHGHGTSSLCAGPTLDSQLLRDLFTATIEASKVLGRDASLCEEMLAFVGKLRDTEVGKDGQIKEWKEDWDHLPEDLEHRHVSHLYGLYPSEQIDPDLRPDLARAAAVTLNTRGDDGPGWATAWRICLWARLRDGERAYSILRRLLGPELSLPNLFDAHPPLDEYSLSCFQIDGNFGGTAGIAEMLISCIGDSVRLLPALPKAWPGGKLHGIRLRGGWTIDLDWDEGRPKRVALKTTVSGRKTVKFGDAAKEISLQAGDSRILDADEIASW